MNHTAVVAPILARAGVVAVDSDEQSKGIIEPLLLLSGRIDAARSSSILIDGGASSNFVSLKFVASNGLKATVMNLGVEVSLADGSPVHVTSYVPRALVELDGHRGRHDLIVLPTLGEFDVILGRSFLVHSRAVVDHAAGSVYFRQVSASKRKVKTAKPASHASLFASVIGEVVSGQPSEVQDQVLRACGLMAAPLQSETVPVLPAVEHDVCTAVMDIVAAYEERMKPFIGTLPPSRGQFDHAIRLINPDVRPRARRAIPLSERHLKSLAKELTKLQEAGLIRPSRSEWAAPVFFVPKDANEDRMIIDLRQLNELTETNNSSLPYVKELFARLGKSVIFSKIDLTSGYHQLRLRESDIPLTGFITPLGHFEWLVTPFGEKNSPASFAQMMSQLVLPDILHTFVLVFQDDILIASESDEDHVAHVQQVLSRLSDHQLWIKPSKCLWAVRDVDFLGHHIRATETGTVIEPCQSKVDAVVGWPVPTSRSELGAFLGLANYYRNFINGFSAMSAKLTALTAPRTVFQWSSEHQQSFDALKSAMSSSPALLAPDDSKPFVLHCDASTFAIGAVLSQHDSSGTLRPVGFYSSKLTDTQLRWDVYEREIFSVVAALQHWFFHLKATVVPIQIYTDHQSLEELAVQLLRPKMARWLTILSEYRYRVTWIPAEQNAAADALSRRHDHDDGSDHRKLTQTLVAQQAHFESGNSLGPGDPLSVAQLLNNRPKSISRSSENIQLGAQNEAQSSATLAGVSVSAAPDTLFDQVRMSYHTDPEARELLNDPAKHGYRLLDGLLMRHGDKGVFVPDSATALRHVIIEECHSVPLAGHVGAAKTLARLRHVFYWPGASRDVADQVASCMDCQKNKSSNKLPAGLLRPLPIVNKGDMITLDFVGPLPRSKRQMDYILVIVDKLSKRAYYEACRSTITAKQAAQIVFRRVVREQGLPSVIVSDRDSRFTSNVWRELWSACGTKLALSTAYHQQTDGQSERQVRTLEESLRSYVNSRGTDWDERLPHVEFAHNTAVHASTGFAPLQLHSGVIARVPFSLGHARQQNKPHSAYQLVAQMETDIVHAQAELKLAQARQKLAYDRRHRDVVYVPGDHVMLSTTDRLPTIAGKKVFLPKWDGPYKVLEVASDGLNVTLELPQTLRIHPVFHVSKVKMANLASNDSPPLVEAYDATHSETQPMRSQRIQLSHPDVMAEEVSDDTSPVIDLCSQVPVLDYSQRVEHVNQSEESDTEVDDFEHAIESSRREEIERALVQSGRDAMSSDEEEPTGPRRSGRRVNQTNFLIHAGQLGQQFGL